MLTDVHQHVTLPEGTFLHVSVQYLNCREFKLP